MRPQSAPRWAQVEQVEQVALPFPRVREPVEAFAVQVLHLPRPDGQADSVGGAWRGADRRSPPGVHASLIRFWFSTYHRAVLRLLVENEFLECRDGRYWRAGGTVSGRPPHPPSGPTSHRRVAVLQQKHAELGENDSHEGNGGKSTRRGRRHA